MVKNLGMVIGIILGLVMGLLMGYALSEDRDDKTVDCYDRFSNKIIGEKCLKEGQEFSANARIISIIFAAIVFSIMGMALGSLWDLIMEPI